MTKKRLFPEYIPRTGVEKAVRRLANQVLADRRSRAVLLYGPGGIGKSVLARHLAIGNKVAKLIWLEPIDVDDSEYWLLPNMERRIAGILSPTGGYFKDYLDHISRLPLLEHERIGHETILAHLRQGEEVFRRCYDKFVTRTGLTPVITLDTVEAIRGTDMLVTLTQWIKRLPGTLFILAGRPSPAPITPDPIVRELADPYQQVPFEQIDLPGFTYAESFDYLEHSWVDGALHKEEKEKLVLLTQGHPLWLALTVSYLESEGMPREASARSLEDLRKLLPYQEPLPDEGQEYYEAFVRRLVIPYHEGDFWCEAIKRLATVRQRINRPIWEQLMADRVLPEGIADWDAAWDKLLHLPWVRPRANRHYLTLHDALAEELARRIIPLHDKEESWRRQQWRTAAQIYKQLTEDLEKALLGQENELDSRPQPNLPEADQRDLIRRSTELDTQERELDQLKAAYFYYQLLADFSQGYEKFIEFFDQATHKHEFRFRELLWLEMQQFLPKEAPADVGDIIQPVVERFIGWLERQPARKYEIEWRGAQYLINIGQPKEADSRLSRLLDEFKGDLERLYRIYNLRGNARMRIPGCVQSAEEDFKQALACTSHPAAPETVEKLLGEAQRELGFYYRHTGDWQKASGAYLEALRVTPLGAQEEKATIQSNWAYIQALRGHYQDALDLVEAALTVRRRRNIHKGVGMALSVKGEVHRYARNFDKAWTAYAEAEEIFAELGDWPWLGMIYQEQAICLFQAFRAGEMLEDCTSLDQMLYSARALALQALDLCRDLSIRAYPSALNRAGRIFGYNDSTKGLEFLEEGIRWAEEVADGWFWFANLIEYAEMCYNVGDADHLARIDALSPQIEQVKKDFDFPDLKGRWELLQGHLKVERAVSAATGDSRLEEALEHYKKGFPLLAKGFVGSHGAYAIPDEFKTLTRVLARLPLDTAIRWCEELQLAWSDLQYGYIENFQQVTPLLGRLTEVYDELTTRETNKAGVAQ